MMEKISRKGFLKVAAAAAMSGITAAGLAACNAASSASGVSSATGIYTPGTYTATAKGMSEITATVTFDANTITKVELDLSGETESIGVAAKDKLIEQIMNAQTSQIDGVTGATVTSKAVQNAVADCIQQASGGAINPAQQSTEETSSTADWLGEAPEIAESDIKQTVDCEVLVWWVPVLPVLLLPPLPPRLVPRPSSSRSLVMIWPAASGIRWQPAAPSSSRRTAMT